MVTIVREGVRRGVRVSHRAPAPEAPGDGVEAVLVAVGPDVDRVLVDGEPVGFVHRAGPVHVALRGTDLARAVEVAQSRELAVAIAALARHPE